MKITKTQLNQIIKEELETVLSEVADIDGATGLPTTPKGLKTCAADEECADRVTMTNRDIVRDPAIKTAVKNTDSVKYARAAWQKTHAARDAEYDAALAQDPQGDARGRTDQSVAGDDPRTKGVGLDHRAPDEETGQAPGAEEPVDFDFNPDLVRHGTSAAAKAAQEEEAWAAHDAAEGAEESEHWEETDEDLPEKGLEDYETPRHVKNFEELSTQAQQATADVAKRGQGSKKFSPKELWNRIRHWAGKNPKLTERTDDRPYESLSRELQDKLETMAKDSGLTPQDIWNSLKSLGASDTLKEQKTLNRWKLLAGVR